MSFRLTPGPVTVDELLYLYQYTSRPILLLTQRMRERAGAVLRAGLNDTIRYDTILEFNVDSKAGHSA